MTVQIFRRKEIRDSRGEVIFSSEDDLLPQIYISGAVNVGVAGVQNWWEQNKEEVRKTLKSFFENLPEVSEEEPINPTMAAVVVPVPNCLLNNLDYSLADELMLDLEEAFLEVVLHRLQATREERKKYGLPMAGLSWETTS